MLAPALPRSDCVRPTRPAHCWRSPARSAAAICAKSACRNRCADVVQSAYRTPQIFRAGRTGSTAGTTLRANQPLVLAGLAHGKTGGQNAIGLDMLILLPSTKTGTNPEREYRNETVDDSPCCGDSVVWSGYRSCPGSGCRRWHSLSQRTLRTCVRLHRQPRRQH